MKHPAITAVGFTGSLKAGRALFDLAASRATPVPVYAEMSSVNPVVILPGAIIDRGEQLAAELSASILLGGGQFCTKPGVIFTFEGGGWTNTLARQMRAQATITMLNQNLRESFAGKVKEFIGVGAVRSVVQGQSSGFASVSPTLIETDAATWLREPKLHEEAFGPAALVVYCRDASEAIDCINALPGNLTGTIHIGSGDQAAAVPILRALQEKVGRIIINGYPTGVEVCNAIVHGGPYPATTDPGTTSVGSAAIRRWVRLIAYQDTPDSLLPPALRNANPLKIERTIDGVRTRDPVQP